MSFLDTSPSTERASFGSEWDAWHARHESARADKHGFLAITSLNFLNAEQVRFADAPGAWSTSERGPVVELAAGESLVIDDIRIEGRHEFGVLPERSSIAAVAGDAVIEIARRGGNDIVRPRHPESVVRTEYTGTPTYAPDAHWVVSAQFHAFDEPRPVTVGSVVEGLEHVYDSPGRLAFTLLGESLTLTAFNGHEPGSLLVLFTDATSGVTTYAANRSVAIDSPDDNGVTFIDFNRAVNLPCAYTEFATCPLPPAENRLGVAVEAGEKVPASR
ncbi:DUF1684 domain-containing protein [soil metagenome]